MVEVGLRGGHPASGKHALAVAGGDAAALRGGGAATGGSVLNRQPGGGIGDGEAALPVGLCGHGLASDVGDDGPVAGQLARRL